MRLRKARTLVLARLLLYLALAVIVYFTIRKVAMVVAPVGTGLFIAYLFNPLVERLERHRVPRPVGITLLVLVGGGAAVAIGLLVPPLLYDDLQRFSQSVSDYQSRLDSTVMPWLRARFHLPRSATFEDAFRRALVQATDTLRGAGGDLASAVSGALQTATGLLRLLLAALLVPVFAIYFLSDYPQLRSTLRDLIPPRHQPQVLSILSEINHALASWVRGQLTVMLILGTLYATGLGLSGVPLGVAIGIVTGLMAFVPYVGTAVGLCLALIAALVNPQPGHAAAGVIATFGAVQAMDALFITPRVLGGQVGLSPVGVILALSLGGELLGYAGLLLAVPSAAVVKVLFAHAHRAYTASPFYQGALAPAGLVAPIEVAAAGPPASIPQAQSPTASSRSAPPA